uniref:Short form D7 salivary protein n=1 Tax=Anopheles atroparvus TaxID=41427 RepID=A0A182ITG1_ANOAO
MSLSKAFLTSFLAWCVIAMVQVTEAAKTVEECERQIPASLKGRLCEVRQYKIIDGPDMDKHMDCVMKALKIVDKEGRGDYHKLYTPMNSIERDRKHDLNLETCIGKTFKLPNVGGRANAFYKCMLNSNSADSFKKAFDLIELIRAGKLSKFAKYSDEVPKMMKKIDAKICK